MTDQLSWEADPIVRLERALVPIIPSILFFYLDSDKQGSPLEHLKELLINGAQEIVDVQSGPMSEMDIYLSKGDQKIIEEGCNDLRKLAVQLPTTFGDAKERQDFFHELKTQQYVKIERIIDIFRETFISTILERHVQSDKSAETARRELRKISKQIFYVSLNASVEASRAGENGAAFNVISQEIRQLAKQAEQSVGDI